MPHKQHDELDRRDRGALCSYAGCCLWTAGLGTEHGGGRGPPALPRRLQGTLAAGDTLHCPAGCRGHLAGASLACHLGDASLQHRRVAGSHQHVAVVKHHSLQGAAGMGRCVARPAPLSIDIPGRCHVRWALRSASHNMPCAVAASSVQLEGALQKLAAWFGERQTHCTLVENHTARQNVLETSLRPLHMPRLPEKTCQPACR